MIGVGASANVKDTVKNYNLEQVVVTATRTPLMISQSPVLTRVVSGQEISKLATPSFEKLLEKEIAGVEFHQAGYGSSLSFQGLDARYVLFLVDGERLSGETYGNVDYTRIPTENIDRIEIVKGASSVLYGSSAMGAVVNILTKMPEKDFEVKGSFRWGSKYQSNKDETLGGNATESNIEKYRTKLDLPNINGNLSVGVNRGKLRSLTMASINYSDAYRLVGKRDELRHYKSLDVMKPKLVNGRPVFDPSTGAPIFEVAKVVADTSFYVAPDARGLSVSGYKNFSVMERLDYQLNEQFRFELAGNYYHKQRYDFNTSISNDNPMSNNNRAWTFENYQGFNTKALMEHSPNKNNKVYLSFIADSYKRSLDSLSGVSTPKQRHTYYKPSLQWTRNQQGLHRLTIGVESFIEKLNFDLNANGSTNAEKYANAESMSSGALYAQQEFFMGKPLCFDLGLRSEYNNRFGYAITPTAALKYRLHDWVLRANYSRGYRAPSLKELYMEFQVPIPGATTFIKGNENLKEETNNYIALSGEVRKSNYQISATLYKSYFTNKIDVVGSTEGTVTNLLYNNINSSDVGGAELLVKVRPINSVEIMFNYNYIHRTDNAPSQTTQYIYPSPHTAILRADYRFTVGKVDLGVSSTLRGVSSKEYMDFMPVIKGRSDYYTGYYSAHMNGYLTLDASIVADYKNYSLLVGVNNISDYAPSVVCFNSATTPPRNVSVKLAFRFD